MKEYSYKRFEIFGRVFYRILERNNPSDPWLTALGTFDWDTEDDAKFIVNDLREKDARKAGVR